MAEWETVDITFSVAVALWAGFFGMAGVIGVGLRGFLVVVLALRRGVLDDPPLAGARAVAALTLVTLLATVAVGLLFRVPFPRPVGLGLPMLAIGLGRIATPRSVAGGAVRVEPSAMDGGAAARTVAVVLVGYVGVLLVALVLPTGRPGALPWLALTVAALLGAGALGFWTVLAARAPG